MLKFLITLTIFALLLELSFTMSYCEWKKFKKTFNKTYASLSEELEHRAIFENNSIAIKQHNLQFQQGNTSFCQKIYDFHDLDNDTATKTLTGLMLPESIKNNTETPSGKKKISVIGPVPKIVDLRPNLPPPEAQGNCASCWAFSTGYLVEACIIKKYKQTVIISKQQILDCSEVDYGCVGGWPASTLSYFISNGLGFNNKADYNPSYIAAKTTCQTLRNKVTYNVLRTFPPTEYLSGESDLIPLLLLYGPVSVAINANVAWQSYANGIFDDKSCTTDCYDVNHAVTIVGYNLTAPIPYWIVKNSWGTSWGVNGHIYMAMHKNLCNIGCWGVTVTC